MTINARRIAVGKREDRDKRAPRVHEKNEADKRDDQDFLDQLVRQIVDGAPMRAERS